MPRDGGVHRKAAQRLEHHRLVGRRLRGRVLGQRDQRVGDGVAHLNGARREEHRGHVIDTLGERQRKRLLSAHSQIALRRPPAGIGEQAAERVGELRALREIRAAGHLDAAIDVAHHALREGDQRVAAEGQAHGGMHHRASHFVEQAVEDSATDLAFARGARGLAHDVERNVRQRDARPARTRLESVAFDHFLMNEGGEEPAREGLLEHGAIAKRRVTQEHVDDLRIVDVPHHHLTERASKHAARAQGVGTGAPPTPTGTSYTTPGLPATYRLVVFQPVPEPNCAFATLFGNVAMNSGSPTRSPALSRFSR